ncbi:class I SAM-dependent methyltransferase [Microbacterium azadirachtae]|uniref:class I SAM-dependent methyltransferase n=1 Tax=Microbacterium azadirachtae TaxID=582680 RepID=UPI000892003D|nr:class I SAM-dependent methyltransferase [Microbacterium azadirachtae]SDL57263.1 demethylmenaquinone methyltransferase / 2-methoxy-6-polyprenyl-1,4-benzoquinol methylase [Microbacterium azadirachtae]SEF85997.1 demethylmenaquinone methyltransferase / 2-methoxy-6-polyprenyl-1,4-benzoquinol methylase [Microbacterium azadirachtae]SEF87850.1 demethylmenaquinone methyltransferase / 2-methoxy-6-polyprenyl-1,4-benzoquinol methylase [Microbacterium azadirachtae]
MPTIPAASAVTLPASDAVPCTPDPLYDPAGVRHLFDRMARSYDRMNVMLSLGFSVLWRHRLLRLVPATGSPRRVLDLMSGRGETWATIERRLPQAQITALDFSDEMLAQAQRRNLGRFAGRVRLRQEDALEQTTPSGSVDVVVSAYGLKTFDARQLERLAAEVARTLRPGGSFAFVDVTEPACGPLRVAYRSYLRWIVPLAGLLLLSDPTEYRMLHRYLAGFGDGSRAVAAFRAEPGLEVEVRRYFFGCAMSISGRRLGTDEEEARSSAAVRILEG